MNPIIPINRIEFQMACTSYQDLLNSQNSNTSSGSSGSSSGTSTNPRSGGFITDDPETGGVRGLPTQGVKFIK